MFSSLRMSPPGLRSVAFFATLGALVFSAQSIFAYHLPPLNLGFTSFLDGGVGPANPGFVFQEYIQHYESNRFLDHNGKKIPGLTNPEFSTCISISQLLYTTNVKMLGGKLGFEVIIPYVISSQINKNPLLLKTSGGGFGDIFLGPYIQWDTIMRGDVPVFSSRVEIDISIPTGKKREPIYAINPGVAFFYLNPYWAATLFFTPKLSASWRLHYLWCARDYKTHIRAGQTVFADYSLEYQLRKNFYVGINGYFLEQLENSRFKNQTIPNSRERVFAIGPGVLYLPTKDFNCFANFYFESCVKNRPEGFRINLRAVKVF